MTGPIQGATLVTGASAGIGEQFARACAGRGERVVLVARRADRLEALARTIGNGAVAIPLDLVESGATARLMNELADEGLVVTRLVNNAGIGFRGRFAELDIGAQMRSVAINIGALTELCHAVIPGMRAAGGGAILNVASTAAFQAGPNMAVYYATKAYVLSLSEALHDELAGDNIAVTALCPGPTRSEFAGLADMEETPLFRFMAGDAGKVVAAGLKALDRNRAVAVPGLLNAAIAQSNRVAPRAVIRRVVTALQG